MEAGRTRKPLVVSPDVFCTPAVQKYENRMGEERGGETRRGDSLSNGKKLALERERERQCSPRGESILAVRDTNIRAIDAVPGGVKRVSFKDVTVVSSEPGVGPATTEGRLAQQEQTASHRWDRDASAEKSMPSPGPWTQLIDGMEPEQSFTHYVNPLASGEEGQEAESLEPLVEQHTPVSQLSRAVDTATSQGVAFHMQTPEAVQVLHKISLHTKGQFDRGSLDQYLRTAPKKLSPEPGMNLLEAGAKIEDATRCQRDQRKAIQKVDATVALESSEDENAVDEGTADAPPRNHQLIVASPIGRGHVVEEDVEASDLDEVPPTFEPGNRLKTSGRVTSPVRFNLLGNSPDSLAANAEKGCAEENSGNEQSFSFGIGGDGQRMADDEAEVTAQLLEACRDAEDEGQEESVDQPNPFGAMLGKLREDPLRLKSPVLGAIIRDANSEGSLAGSPESPANCTPMNLISTSSVASMQSAERRLADLGQDIAVNRHAAEQVGARFEGDEELDVLSNASSLDEWMRKRGVKHISTPTRIDLQKMWDALDNIRETTGAYADVLRENAQLREELWETREAELDARAELEEANEIVRFEQERSRDAADKMAELAMSMYQQFALLEEERRQLQTDLDHARQMLDASMDEGAANVMQEIDTLKSELERLRVAEEAARADAASARAAAKSLQDKMDLFEDAAVDDANPETDVTETEADFVEEALPGDAVQAIGPIADGVADGIADGVAGEIADGVAHQNVGDEFADKYIRTDVPDATVANLILFEEGPLVSDGVQGKVKFFEQLQFDARCGIKEPDQISDVEFCPAMSPYGDAILPECPHTGIRAPRTTPVDADDMTTPYRIHVETMNQFRGTWKQHDGIQDDGKEDTESEETAHADSETSESDLSDYEVENIVVSPIDVEDLTRANLRQTVMQRIAAVKSDLASAKSRLGHAQSGFRGRAASKSSTAAAKAAQETTPVLDAIMEHVHDGASDCDEVLVTDSSHVAEEELEVHDAVDVQCDLEEAGGNVAMSTDPGPASASQSHRSIFARRLDATSTSLSIRKAIFTPKAGVSSLKSTAHMSPRFSSAASSATPLPPSYLQQEPIVSRPAHRTRRFGYSREPSAEEDREFRRRAAALNIHVSPYMKRSGRRQVALN